MNNYFMETHHHEWILTNRLGSYALGTGNLINQRKYHGLLIAGDKAFNRRHLVAGIEERVEWRGEVFHLDSNNYSNCIYPEGFMHLVKPWLRPFPAFLYSALPHQDEILVLKEIMMDENSNCTLVRYTNLGQHKLHFEFHPKFTMCMHHDLNPHGCLDYEHYDCKIESSSAGTLFSATRGSNGIDVHGYLAKGEVINNRYVYYNVYYPWEVMAGYAGIGDQISLFEASFDLAVGETNYLLFADKPIDNAQKLIQNIEKRYSALPKALDYPDVAKREDGILGSLDYNDNILFKRPQYMQILDFALNDFIANDDVIAGYPFYGAWGRDTMVVLNALLHSNKHLDVVEKTLIKYSRHIKNGLIPNMLAESGREANYDSIDATLWYIILLWKLGKQKKSKTYWHEVIHITESIFGSLFTNDEANFSLRDDALIELSPAFSHGTWMDVRIDGKPVTPRWGAPIEVNALWYNALCCYESMCEEYPLVRSANIEAREGYLSLKDKVKTSLAKFRAGDYLADRLEGDKAIIEIRPNVIIALSLPWPIMDKDMMKKALERCFQELYTFYGIRTLSPKDIRFRKKYYGPQRDRDLAYHNGSVWAWLFGPFCGLYVKVYKDEKSPRELALALSDFIGTLRKGFMRGHIASVAEVWDGDAPHFPKGAPAQAWSVAALYNIESYIDSLGVEL
ncbi:MAG: glycogen debranching enzyme N-terminal domain-containing protein [Candidatus Cloacimonetes bacterium]|nr:glycogen debranching enzyme N-terminal domain-containing protein [Candidatus Cloacimonadota bacterium]